MNKKIGIGDIAYIIFALIFFVGILTFFSPCGPKADGSWMNCHWAGHALIGLAAVQGVLAIIHFFLPKLTKVGVDIAAFVLAVLAIVLPGTLIPLCGMKTMQCNTLMHPAVIIVNVCLLLSLALDIFLQIRKPKK